MMMFIGKKLTYFLLATMLLSCSFVKAADPSRDIARLLYDNTQKCSDFITVEINKKIKNGTRRPKDLTDYLSHELNKEFIIYGSKRSTLLMHAVLSGSDSCLAGLLDASIEMINPYTRLSETMPLKDIIEPNQKRSEDGATALSLALNGHNYKIVDVLLELNIDMLAPIDYIAIINEKLKKQTRDSSVWNRIKRKMISMKKEQEASIGGSVYAGAGSGVVLSRDTKTSVADDGIEQEYAAVKIQKAHRGHKARKHAKKLSVQKRHHSAAGTIQQAVRGMQAKKRVTAMRNKKHSEAAAAAATRIQSTMRGKLAKNRVGEMRTAREDAIRIEGSAAFVGEGSPSSESVGSDDSHVFTAGGAGSGPSALLPGSGFVGRAGAGYATERGATGETDMSGDAARLARIEDVRLAAAHAHPIVVQAMIGIVEAVRGTTGNIRKRSKLTELVDAHNRTNPGHGISGAQMQEMNEELGLVVK